MKRLAIVLAVLFVFSVSAQAQMGGMSGEGMMEEQKSATKPPCMSGSTRTEMMSEGQQMPMMQMCMPMMQQMMGQGMMMRDMMQMMMDMMKMQKKTMIMGPAERKEMMMEIDKMMERLDKMMSDMRGMMMKGMMGPMPMEQKKEGTEAPAKEDAPKGDPHKH